MGKLFGGLKMGWPGVVLFAIGAGLITGILGSIPATEGTSFRDIAISYEWWVIFAFIIACNCKKGWESALKTFVFFLVSQPLVFAVEVLCGHLGADMALYYYSSIWGPATLFTLPGGFVAYFIQKQNALGPIVLGLGCTLQLFLGVSYTMKAIQTPPFHLLSALVCFASVFVMTFCIQKSTKNRVATLAIAVGVTVLLVALLVLDGRTLA